MSTRIIVKNLPPYLTQDAFTKHFSDYSSPTDSKLQTSKSGKSRRFGFVGFQSDSEAESAVQYWNNTYIGSTKVSAELARTVAEEAATNYKRKAPEDALITAQSAKGKKRRRSDLPAEENDPKYREFLRLNEKRSKSKTFLNDDEDVVQQAGIVEEAESEEDAEIAEYQTIRKAPTFEVIEHDDTALEAVDEAPFRVTNTVSDDADDAEWLRSRTSRTLDLSDGTEPQPVRVSPVERNVAQASSPRSTPAKTTHEVEAIDVVKTQEELEAEETAIKAAAKSEAIRTIKDTARLFVRNLAFTADEVALRTLFDYYGEVAEVHIPQSKTGASKGTAYIHFERSSDAITAFEDLDGKSFHGRLLHILPGQAKISIEKPAVPGSKNNVGEKRKEERRREAAKSRFNWNALFLNQNAVLDHTAKKFGVSKSELLDPTQSSAAVTMALAESSALNTIKKFFLSHGVNLQSFSQTKQKDDSILLFKNLPSQANEAELTKLVEGAGGVIRRIVMPDIGGLAIVEVVDGNMGKSVFGKLAYRKFGDGLIYLEKGPINTFTSIATDSIATTITTPDDTKNGAASDEEDEEEKATIFVKNLNFETRAPDLTNIFSSLRGFRSATVKTKPNPKDTSSRLSMGFGFVQFANTKDAGAALSTMQGFTLDAHALQLSLSTGRSDDAAAAADARRGATIKGGTKVVVKNLPFETSRADLQRLFGTYGTIKSLRVPKKHDAKLRGFAFLEFVSKRDAKNAIESVRGTHLLGRRLVLEYAETELRGEEGVDQLIDKTRHKRAAVEAVEGGRRKIGKVNLDGKEEDGFE